MKTDDGWHHGYGPLGVLGLMLRAETAWPDWLDILRAATG